jgi:hypothetical protein
MPFTTTTFIFTSFNLGFARAEEREDGTAEWVEEGRRVMVENLEGERVSRLCV